MPLVSFSMCRKDVTKMTIAEFSKKIEDYLQNVTQDISSLAGFLKDTLQLDHIKSEGVAAIKMQRPDAQYVTTAQDWRKHGYRLKAGEFERAIKVITSYKEQYFVREGNHIPVAQATSSERQQILIGTLPVQETIKSKMQLVYDVSQTDCPPAEYSNLKRTNIHSLSVDQRYELMRALIADKGVNCIGDNEMTILDADGYYDSNKDEIHIAEGLKDYQKLAAFCECTAACIVGKTTMCSGPVQVFEAAYLAMQLKQMTGVPIDDAQYAGAAELFMQIPERSVKLLDESLTRSRRAGEYVGNDLQEMYRGFMQAQGMDLSMLNTQVAQNFIQDLG